MVKKGFKIIWSAEARIQFKKAYNFIKKDSVQNAEKVRYDIITIIKKIPQNPGKHPSDKYKLNNYGSYRAFEKHSYRIVYRVLTNEIRILRVRHVKMEPLEY